MIELVLIRFIYCYFSESVRSFLQILNSSKIFKFLNLQLQFLLSLELQFDDESKGIAFDQSFVKLQDTIVYIIINRKKLHIQHIIQYTKQSILIQKLQIQELLLDAFFLNDVSMYIYYILYIFVQGLSNLWSFIH